MIDISKDGLVQRTMSVLCNVSPTTISRYITSNDLKPLDKSVSKNQRFSIENSRNIISDITFKNKKRILKKKFALYNFKGGVV